MRHGWIYLYEEPPAEKRCEEFLDHFGSRGISLAEPESGRVIRLSDEGKQVLSSREDILNHCKTDDDVFFNVYFGPSDNIFCAFHKINAGLLRESFNLDGKTESQSISIITILASLFATHAENGLALAFIADRYAELHRDFHWDDFVLGATTPPEWPLCMGFLKSFARLTDVPSSYHRVDKGNFVMFDAGGTDMTFS